MSFICTNCPHRSSNLPVSYPHPALTRYAISMIFLRATVVIICAILPLAAADEGWISLFNGKDLTGWKVNENPSTFSVQDGAIVAHGPRSHCFYVGDFHDHNFKDFELKVDVMTKPGSNGGIYIQTEYQDEGWPGKG